MESQSGFYRSGNNKVIAGVCAGLAARLNLDPVVVRIFFVLLTIFAGGGVLAYVILWIVMPERFVFSDPHQPVADPADSNVASDFNYPEQASEPANSKTQLIIGLLLIFLGGLLLVATFIPRIDIHDLWPVALILIGFLLLKPSGK